MKAVLIFDRLIPCYDSFCSKFCCYINFEFYYTEYNCLKFYENMLIINIFNNFKVYLITILRLRTIKKSLFLDDLVYMPDERKLDEYVLTDVGKIWVGPHGSAKGREWVFGQFDKCVLPATMLMFEKSGLPHSRYLTITKNSFKFVQNFVKVN